MPAGDELLTTDELAALLKESKKTVYHRNLTGDGPRRVRVGRRVLYRRSDVEQWLNSRYVGGAAA